MTSFPAGHLQPWDTGSPSDEGQPGALLRVSVREGWEKRLPRVPAGLTVTVSLSSDAANAAHGAALRFLGYRVVDPSGIGVAGADVADFVVPALAATEHRAWWRALGDRADRTYPLAFGPVLLLLGPALRPHRAYWLAERP